MERDEIRFKLGQCICVGYEGTWPSDEFLEFITEHKIGNIILFAQNLTDKQQIKKLCTLLNDTVKAATGLPAFIMTDQEGGPVTRLPEDCINVPGAMAIASSGSPKNAYLAGKLTGYQLKSLGINVDLAPVADINSCRENPVIGVRSYGDNADSVSEYVIEMAKGLMEEGVMPCVKHFPGHGDTSKDSHLALPCVPKTKEELCGNELKPFKKAVEAGVPAVMTAHILFPAFEEENIPATMSYRILKGLLRDEMGHKGIIFTDCMEMKAIASNYGATEACIKALNASADIVLISNTYKDAIKTIEELEAAVSDGRLDIEEVENSVKRILFQRQRFSGEVCDNIEDAKQINSRLFRSTLTVLNGDKKALDIPLNNPLFVGCRAYRVSFVGNIDDERFDFPSEMKKRLGGDSELFSADPDEKEIKDICAAVGEHSCVVLGTYNSHLKKRQGILAGELSEFCKKQNIPMVHIALRNPYDLTDSSDSVIKIAAWEYTKQCFDALSGLLRGDFASEGTIPVKII